MKAWLEVIGGAEWSDVIGGAEWSDVVGGAWCGVMWWEGLGVE